jgi:hypothetical protein
MQKCKCGKRMECVASYPFDTGKKITTHFEYLCDCGSVRIVNKKGKEVD